MSGIQVIDGKLAIDNKDVGQIACRFGTPLFIYGGESIASGIEQLKASLGDCVEIYYSIKANPAIGVCKLINSCGIDGAEIASSGELVAAIKSGFEPPSLLFAGPGKTDDELDHAIRAGVGQINAESESELLRINQFANEQGLVQRVGIRVNLEDQNSGHGKIKTGGGPQKFGIDESRVTEAIKMISACEALEFVGLHTMFGSQVLDTCEMLRSCKLAIQMAIRVGETSGVGIQSLNFGGGLGVSHHCDESFDMAEFGRLLTLLIADSRSCPALKQTSFMIEPGRILVSKHGVYVSSVVDVKESVGQTVAILDGGIHHALLPITANIYRVMLVDQDGRDTTQPVTLGGPLCTSADQWRSQVTLPEVRIGDQIAMLNSGAYGLSASMNMFLSRGTPAEVLVLHGIATIIRERSTPQDVLDGQHIPSSLD